MKKYDKYDLIEKFKSFGDNVKEARNFADNLSVIKKGYIINALKIPTETYYIEKNDLKEEINSDLEYCHNINEKYSKEDKKTIFLKNNEELRTDIDINKVETNTSFYKQFKENIENIETELYQNNEYTRTYISPIIESSIRDINNTSQKLNGQFKIEYTPENVIAFINDYDKGMVEFNFKPSDSDMFMKKLSEFFNATSKDTDYNLSDLGKIFSNITDFSYYDSANRNSKVVLYIDGKDSSNNLLEIINDDKKINLVGNEVDLGKLMILDNYTINIFDIEKEKVEKHLRQPLEIERDIEKIEKKLLKEDFTTLRHNVFGTVLSNIKIQDETENFQKNTEELKYKVLAIYEDIFIGLGEDFKNKFLIKNAERMKFTVTEDNKIAELISIGRSTNYEENLNDFVSSLYMQDVEEFEEKMTNFVKNPNDDIENKFSTIEMTGYYGNPVPKLEKAIVDIYKYITDEKVEKELKIGDRNLAFSKMAQTIGLNISEYSDKINKLDKEFKNENINKNTVKNSYNTDEIISKKEKTNNIEMGI